ncbi:putative reverse transcriptase domain-containing protein [Tanacetum coccineum]
MANVIPLDHVDDVPVVEPNQPDAIPVILEPVLVDEDEDPEEEEFEEEEEPQEEENDMEVDPLNPPPPSFESEHEDMIEVEDTVEPGDKTVPASVHEVGESSTAPFLREDSDGLFPGLMRRDINSLFGQMTSLSRRLCGRETAHALAEKKGKAKDEYYEKVECKKLKKELEEARFSNTLLRMHNERVERDLYWTRVRAHEFYREMIRRGFMFEERPNEAIDVPVEDEESPSSESRGSFCDSFYCVITKLNPQIMPPKFASLTQAGVRRMIKESVDADIAAEKKETFIRTVFGCTKSKKSVPFVLEAVLILLALNVSGWLGGLGFPCIPKTEFRVFYYRVWKLIDTPYQAMWDTAYWGFLGVRTTVGMDTSYLLDGYNILGKTVGSFLLTKMYSYGVILLWTAYSSKLGNGLLILQCLCSMFRVHYHGIRTYSLIPGSPAGPTKLTKLKAKIGTDTLYLLDGYDVLSGTKVTKVYIIGGDGTQKGASAIYEEVRRRGLKVAVVGIPKPIYNDKNVITTRKVGGFGSGLMLLSTFEELQMLSFFLQMGFTLILATLDGLDVGLLGDVFGEDDCDGDE